MTEINPTNKSINFYLLNQNDKEFKSDGPCCIYTLNRPYLYIAQFKLNQKETTIHLVFWDMCDNLKRKMIYWKKVKIGLHLIKNILINHKS